MLQRELKDFFEWIDLTDDDRMADNPSRMVSVMNSLDPVLTRYLRDDYWWWATYTSLDALRRFLRVVYYYKEDEMDDN